MRWTLLATLCVALTGISSANAGDCCDSQCGASNCCDTACDACCDTGCGQCCDDVCGDCCDIDSCCGRSCWVRIDALWLEREDSDNGRVLVRETGSGDRALSTDDLEFDTELGYQLEAGFMASSGHGLSVRYFKVDDFESNRVTGDFEDPITDDFTFVDDFFPNFSGVGGIDARFTSELESGEVNYRVQCGRMAFLIGYRHVELNDSFSLVTTVTGFPEDVLDLYGLETENKLDGLQLGVEGCLYEHGQFRLEGFAKGGIYNNDISIETGSFYSDQTASAQFEENETAFVGEVALIGVYQITDHVALRGGYQALWLDGVASGLGQFDVVDLSTAGTAVIADVDTSTLFYQGAVLGVEISR